MTEKPVVNNTVVDKSKLNPIGVWVAEVIGSAIAFFFVLLGATMIMGWMGIDLTITFKSGS